MKGEHLFKAIGAADPELLEQSEQFEKSRNRRVIWLKWSAVAACLCFLLLVVGNLPREGLVPTATGGPSSPEASGSSSGQESSLSSTAEPWGIAPTPPVIPTPAPEQGGEELPLLEGYFEQTGGMGYDGVVCYDVSQDIGANPWTEEAELETLPVYRNLAYSLSGNRVYLSEEQLLSMAEWSAYCLGSRVETAELERVSKENLWQEENRLTGGEAEWVFARTESGDEIRFFGDGRGGIIFAQPKWLPEEYSFTLAQTNDEQAETTVKYLLEEHAPLLEQLTGRENVEDYGVNSWCEYSFSGEMHRYYSAYDDSGTLEERIVNYNLSRLVFSPSTEGEKNGLRSMALWDVLPSAQKLGDYPLLSPETARALLLQGDYIANVPKDRLRDGILYDEDIAGVTLVYRTGSKNQYFQPYYLFYVELPKELEVEGLKDYGRFYVPAVNGEYLTDFPSWDGSYK